MEIKANIPGEKANVVVKEQYKKFTGRKILFIVIIAAVIVFIAGYSATRGSFPISVFDVYKIIFEKIIGIGMNSTQSVVIWNLRLPRICIGIVAGLGLGIAGAVMQSILRNPLASPFTLGVSAGAGFGAALAIMAGLGVAGGYMMIVGNAFIFSLVPAFIIMILTFYKRASAETLILAGVAIMYLFSASTTLLMYFSTSDAVKQAYFWSIGSLDNCIWDYLLPMLIIVTITMILILWKSQDLNIMTTGDDTAKSLGINVNQLRVSMMVLSSLMAAAVVAFVGSIGFVGLVAPHICRMVIGGDNRFLVPASGLMGAALLIGSDLIARTIMAPIILPVGLVTDFVGAPIFIYLIMRRNKEYW